MTLNNKIEELENSVIESKTEDKLVKALDPLVLWLEEMQKSFLTIFWRKSNLQDVISLKLDLFEKKRFTKYNI